MIKYLTTFAIILLIVGWSPAPAQGSSRESDILRISVQSRIPSELDSGAYILVNEIRHWKPEETAIIICDMWDQHWCRSATKRVNELAPVVDKVVKIAREKGVLIVHAPSDVVDYYDGTPQRELGERYPDKKLGELLSGDKLAKEMYAFWPIDQSDEGCDCEEKCRVHYPWTRQHEAIEIMTGDVISDSGKEMAGLFRNRGISNVILVGVHVNMCIVNRSFGLRNMVRLGTNVVLMRDLTDAMYNPEMAPQVSHFTGNSLMFEYIESYIAPTMVSTDFTGEKQFRFKDDPRPLVAFVTAEGEYRANQRLPEFAHALLLKENVNCEFALGKPAMEGEGRHNMENLQILQDADLAVFFARRRALEHDKMALIRDFVLSEKPVMGIRTASHAFDARKPIPREGGPMTLTDGTVTELLDQWPEFDREVLGGNYQGHYGQQEEGTKISVIPGMEAHPLLHSFPLEGFTSSGTLYRNRPLRSTHAQVLLMGTIPGQEAEPVFWINDTGKNKVIYTSLGHWDDWEEEEFRKLMINSVRYLLGKEISKYSDDEETNLYK